MSQHSSEAIDKRLRKMMSQADLRQLLLQLDQRSYKAYKDIQGLLCLCDFTLIIDRVQEILPVSAEVSCLL